MRLSQSLDILHLAPMLVSFDRVIFTPLIDFKVGANIIAMYPPTSLFVAVGQLAVVILVLFSYPLQVHPCRNCLDKVFHAGSVPSTKVIVHDDDEEEEENLDELPSAVMTPLKHSLLTSAIVASGFTIAYFVDNLQMGKLLGITLGALSMSCVVLSFVGSTGSTTISFILPGLFYWKVSLDVCF